MKFIVSLNYKQFTFDTIEEAGTFACIAKRHSSDVDLRVEIGIEENDSVFEQEDRKEGSIGNETLYKLGKRRYSYEV